MSDDDHSERTEEEKKANRLKTGIGIGIGSAAVVAALLYANHARKKKSDKRKD
jgi:homoserine kinase